MSDKEILAGAPDVATHYDICTSTYWHNSSGGYYLICSYGSKTCNAVIGKSRSLADIRALVEKDERIKGLEKSLQRQTKKVQLLEPLLVCNEQQLIAELEKERDEFAVLVEELTADCCVKPNTESLLAKRDIEMRAQGVTQFANKYCRNLTTEYQVTLNHDADQFIKQLREWVQP